MLRALLSSLSKSSTFAQLICVVDAVTIGIAMLACLGARGFGQSLAITLLAAIVLFALAGAYSSLYRSWRTAPVSVEIFRLWMCWIGSALVLIAGLYVTAGTTSPPREVILPWLLLAPILLSAGRLVLRTALHTLRRRGANLRRVAIIGATPIADRIAAHISDAPWMGLTLLGVFDATGGDEPPERSAALAGSAEDLLILAREGGVDMVYVALSLSDRSRVEQIMNQLLDHRVVVYYAPDFLFFRLFRAQWDQLVEVPVVNVFEAPLYGLAASIKRIEDLVIASGILVVMALPMLAIAIGIKIASPGPVLFKQRRYGFNGEQFEIWKFRTMDVDAGDEEFRQTRHGDPRVFAFGALLRRSSMDELPQFFNVLQGSMSVVGPRPHPIALEDRHRDTVARYHHRQRFKPGITGWAQVNGHRGPIESRENMAERIEYDLEYVHRWTPLFDLKIIMLTIIETVNGRNAY